MKRCATRSRSTDIEPNSRINGTIRCAIYTRKSTEEGLEQEFNSLDAQRESAEAYILSQRHEGWICLPDHYDDGGFSGGNMERPALQRLFADIDAGHVDCVVVYKVDRMSRAILDFARIIDLFDKHSISFVSVTQQFNTTDSMGRLTLNILLSFAQFEREIISERTRDKMSAARRKGKWVGGHPVLGYDVHPQGGRLVVNQDEAEQVRAIYQLYLEHQAMIPVVHELQRRGWTTKYWTTKKGRELGGKPFRKASLFRLLTNTIYTGNVDFKGTIYKGEHEAIMDAETWQRVQETLRRNGKTGGERVRNKYGALLKGLLFCTPCGTGMVHTYTSRSRKIYRYYVCLNAQQRGWQSCPSKSINAHEIETAVVNHIRGISRNEKIIAATAAKVRQEGDRHMSALEAEQRGGKRELKRLNERVQKLVRASFAKGSGKGPALDQLADLQDRISALEQRMTVIREQVSSIQKQTVDENDLKNALGTFDPVWESLAPREQSRIVRLLVERVGYD
ncbi:MAG: recombinase family protein [Desulfatitalea sp.]|nr:recombinase family protein [Desulfatitalea sp.]NNK00115.1 recombinase family protein [Desulfatitalea sp.]